ncbi:hypothetical protein LRS11_09800 [Pseudomonas sp. J452]|uniref:hypothetical protein n=1 Tax=Pseudomonas sp. J452 TaxID=2898441 RepID=UPI0021AE1572|nr:hypothetical protein [Pseudomonas sp. J452]UUY10290.1 hypothetical protein LRS11_09800 [Pseudomonas sp. J452]
MASPLITRAKKISKALVAIGALAGAILALKELGSLLLSNEPEIYDEEWIPLVYEDIDKFRDFLDRNNGAKVTINSSIAMDTVLPINYLIHQACDMKTPDHPEGGDGNTFYSFGLPTFSKDFDSADLRSATYSEKSQGLSFPPQILSKVKCLDTLRIELIDPTTFRWSYGGTGTQSLPLSGTFKVTTRAFSGPRIEYTLRQVEE